MIARLALTLLLIGLGWLAYLAVTRLLLRKRSFGLSEHRQGSPAILYFTSPGCVSCASIQQPAIQQVKAMYRGHLQVIEIDVTKQPSLADSWGVLSLPTTFVIDAQGRPRGVNLGVAKADRLMSQLEAIEKAADM